MKTAVFIIDALLLLRLVLVASASSGISGWVVDGSGTPLIASEVVLDDSVSFRQDFAFDGFFNFANLSPGTFVVVGDRRLGSFNTATRIVVLAEGENLIVNLTLPVATGSRVIGGVYERGVRSGLQGANILVEDKNGQIIRNANANRRGRYNIENMPDGTGYNFFFTANGFETVAWMNRTLEQRPNSRYAYFVELDRIQSLVGRVESNSNPVAGVIVVVYDSRTGDILGESGTDEMGNYEIEGLSAHATTTLAVIPPPGFVGQVTQHQPVIELTPMEITESIPFPPVTTKTVYGFYGNVFIPPFYSLTGVSIVARDATTSQVAGTATTNSFGQYFFVLPQGTYMLRVLNRDFGPVTSTLNESTEFNIPISSASSNTVQCGREQHKHNRRRKPFAPIRAKN